MVDKFSIGVWIVDRRERKPESGRQPWRMVVWWMEDGQFFQVKERVSSNCNSLRWMDQEVGSSDSYPSAVEDLVEMYIGT